MANGVMTIKYGSENIASRANKAIGELSDIGSRLGSVRRKLGGIPERRGDNLRTASSFLRKKIEQMERREAALETLLTRRVAAALETLRDTRADFLGLGSRVELEDAEKFRALEKDFDALLPELQIRVTVNGQLRHTNDIKDGEE